MKFQAISAILLLCLAFAGLQSASALKLIWDRGYVVIIGNDKETFHHYFQDSILVLSLRDEHGNGGDVRMGEYGDYGLADAKVAEMSFVVEPVATDEIPASQEDEDQVWFKESSTVLLKSVAMALGNIRIRELTGREQNVINSYKKTPNHKQEKFMIIYDRGTVIVQATPALISIGYDAGSGQEFVISGMEEDSNMVNGMFSGRVEGVVGKPFDLSRLSFVIKGSSKPVECAKTSAHFEFYCMGNIRLTELN